MTRIKIFRDADLERLEVTMNQEIEAIEANGYAVKSVHDLSDRSGHAVMVVYGNGPVTIQRWGGRTA